MLIRCGMKQLIVLKEWLKIVGERKGCGQLIKETWCQNKKVQAAIIFERERERESSIPRCRDNVAYENYEVAKREVKRWLKTLNVKFMINYIPSWGGWNEKIIFINMLR